MMEDFFNKGIFLNNFFDIKTNKFNFYPKVINNQKNFLINEVFAAKILYMTGNIDEKFKNLFLRNILDYKKKSGLIYDNKLSIYSFPRRFFYFLKSFKTNLLKNSEFQLAETRQSLAILKDLNFDLSDFLFDFIDTDYEKFIKNMDWKNPWHSCSQFSHLIFFKSLNLSEKKYEDENYYFDYVISNYQNDDGFIYKKGIFIEENIKINGMMKFISAVKLNQNYSKFILYPEKIIDTCLHSAHSDHGCDHLNVIFILNYLTKITDYKKNDIKLYFWNRLEQLKKHYFKKYSAFSFYEGQSNDQIYMAKIGKKYNLPDLHGSVLIILTISLILEITKSFKMNIKSSTT